MSATTSRRRLFLRAVLLTIAAAVLAVMAAVLVDFAYGPETPDAQGVQGP
jgi:hypothetical protein